MRYTLPISTGYVKHWGLWAATRELLQNAFDQRDRDGIEAVWGHEGATMTIASGGHLAVSSLVLGETDKDSERGKFGEGYKLALLVLCRLGHQVVIRNGDERWSVFIQYSKKWQAEVLVIEVTDADEWPGVTFQVHGVSYEDFEDMQGMVNHALGPLLDAANKGKVFVGGLFICEHDTFAYGYGFKPGELPLDRDRSVVDGVNLAYATSELWASSNAPIVADLLQSDAPDIAYIAVHAHAASSSVRLISEAWSKDHADAVPVTTQVEVEDAQAAGLKWVLVPAPLKAMLSLVRSWLVPNTKSPVERLEAVLERFILSSECRAELKDIIRCMR